MPRYQGTRTTAAWQAREARLSGRRDPEVERREAVRKAAAKDAWEYQEANRRADAAYREDFAKNYQPPAPGSKIRERGDRDYFTYGFEVAHHLNQSLLPVINELLEKVVSDGAYDRVWSARHALNFEPLLKFKASDEYHNETYMWLHHLYTMISMLQENPEKFKADLYKGLIDRAGEHKLTKKLQRIMRQEAQSAFDNGWFPSKQAAYDALIEIYRKDPKIENAYQVADALRNCSVTYFGDLYGGDVYIDAAKAMFADLKPLRSSIQKMLAGENAKIWQAKDLAGLYLQAAGSLSDREGAVKEIEQSFAQFEGQGVISQLLSLPARTALRGKHDAAIDALELAKTNKVECLQSFETARDAASQYITPDSSPEDVLVYTAKIVQAAAPA